MSDIRVGVSDLANVVFGLQGPSIVANTIATARLEIANSKGAQLRNWRVANSPASVKVS